MVVAFAAPLRVINDPAAMLAGLRVPEIEYVCGTTAVAVKFWPVKFEPLTVSLRLAGANV